MKRQIVPCGIFALLLLLPSCNRTQQTSEINQIDIAEGIEKLAELKVSDLGKTIQYIPLETTDSCLIGDFPEVKLLDDKIMIHNGKQCLLFDKQTGKFICSVGHRGDDPEAYNSTNGYLNQQNQLLYFNREPNQLVKYDQKGEFAGIITIPTPETSTGSIQINRPGLNGFIFCDSIIVGHYVGGLGQKCPSSVLYFSEKGNFIDTIPNIIPELGTGQVDDISSISVRKGFGLLGGIIHIQYSNGKQSICVPNHTALWKNNNEIRFKELFTDTIYTLKDYQLEKHMIFNTGKYHWPAEERTLSENNSDRILVSYAIENNKLLYFQFIRGLYTEKPVLYNGIYDKKTKVTHIALADNKFIDDLTQLMPFNPTFFNEKGEYASLVQADDILSWLEEHPEIKIEKELSVLKELNEESNPVVVLVK